MENHVFAAVLVAALLHAGWNSVVKLGLDRVSTVLLLALVQALIAIPILPSVPRPATEAWSWIVAAAMLHTGYKVFLVQGRCCMKRREDGTPLSPSEVSRRAA